MKRREKNAEGIFEKPHGRAVALVFVLALLARGAPDVFFHMNYGWHATNHAEAWFYAEVMDGLRTPANGASDPTVWLLRAFGVLFPGGSSFHAVIAASAILSSFTAVALYFLADELYGRKSALIAGVAWATMSEPIALGISGFTHDHLQLLLISLAILSAIKSLTSSGWARPLFAAAFVAAVFLGSRINDGIWVGFAVAAMAVSHILLQQSPALRRRMSPETIYLVCICFLVIASIASGFTILKDILEAQLEGLPQGRLGSFDVVPTTPAIFWLRYNVLLFMVPYGLLAAFRRKDVPAIMLTVFGVIFSLMMDRGGRISDLGIALLFAVAASDWGVGPVKGIFSRRNTLKATIVISAVTFILFASFASSGPKYSALYLLTGAVLAHSLMTFRGAHSLAVILLAASAAGFGTAVFYVTDIPRENLLTEAEYDVLNWLGTQGRDGRILTGWDRGHMAEYITRMGSVSNAGVYDKPIHDLLWLEPGASAAGLRGAGVTHILMNSANYNVYEDASGRTYTRIVGSLVQSPEKPLSKQALNRTAIYSMRYLDGGGHFTLIRSKQDAATGIRAYIYEVNP
ncbi:MAG: glycosyltransferase family 39 protein [Candidatus Altiarchaeota archaeon]